MFGMVFRIVWRVVLSIALVFCLSVSSYASPAIVNVGFTNYPLGPMSNAGPQVVLNDVEKDSYVRFRIYKKKFGFDEKVYDKNLTVPSSHARVTLTGLWVPKEAGMYRVDTELRASNGNKLDSEDSNDEYFLVSNSNYNWVGRYVNHIFAATDLVGDWDGDDKSNTVEDVYLFLKNAYEHNRKYLFYFSFDLSHGVWGGLGTANGGMFSIDLADYYGLSDEGKDGFVSSWLVGRSFVGYTPLPSAYAIGLIPIQFTPGREDSREDATLFSAGANLQLLSSHAKLQYKGDVSLTGHNADPVDFGKDYSVGVTYNPQVELEIKKEQLNRMLARSIFDRGVAAVAGSYIGHNIDIGLSIFFARSVMKLTSLLNNTETIQQARALSISDGDQGQRSDVFLANELKLEYSNVELSPDESLPIKVSLIGGPLSDPNGVTKIITDADYEWTSVPNNSLAFENGHLRWNSASDEAVLHVKQGLLQAQLSVVRKGVVPQNPGVNLAIDMGGIPRMPISLKTGNVKTRISADGAVVKDAVVRWSITKDGVRVKGGRMAHTGSGEYEVDIRWPNLDGLCNFVVSATKDNSVEKASQVIRFYPPDPDYGPQLIRKNPDRTIETNGGEPIDFKVVAKTVYDTLDKVEWLYDGVLHKTDDLEYHQRYEAVSEYTVTPAKRDSDYRTSVRAKVYREDGEVDSLFWSINVVSNEKPIVSKIAPNSAEKIIIPLGLAGRTTFIVDVSDADDDTRELLWYVNGKMIDDDVVGGGDPKSQESFTHIFSEGGEYVVEAIATDERGNRSQCKWDVHAGIKLEGNTAPEGTIQPPDGLNWGSTFRVGYRYDFDYDCIDMDGNLAYAAVYLDGKQEWCPWYTSSSDPLWPYVDERMQGYEDSPNIYDIVFTEPGQHEIKLFIRDGSDATTTITKVVNVEGADAGSSTAPTIVFEYPENTNSFTVQSGSDLEFEFGFKDPDGDMEILYTYVDGSEYATKRNNIGNTFCLLDIGLDNLPDGSHSVYFEMVDRAGNSVKTKTYSVNVSSRGNHSPVFDFALPGTSSTLYVGPNTETVKVRVRGSDSDGDIDHVKIFNSAGTLSDIDGTEGGLSYDKKNVDSDGINYFNDDYSFNVVRNGTIRVKIVDGSGNAVTKVWQVRKVPSLATGSAPHIANCSVDEGEVFNIKYKGEEVSFYGDITDPDGDLARIEAWKDGSLVDTMDLSQYEGNGVIHFGDNEVVVDSTEDYREKVTPILFKVIDKAGNVAEINAFYSMGPWNHEPNYPDEAIKIQTTEDTDVSIMPEVVDEDGDIIRAQVKTKPEHGSVSGSPEALRYLPKTNFTGDDQLVLSCDDGFGGTGDVVVKISVTPMNDSAVVVDSSGQPANVISVQLDPGKSFNMSDLIDGYGLEDPDGATDIHQAPLTILAESKNLGVAGAVRNEMGIRKSSGSALVITPTDSSETQFLSVAFQDEGGRHSTPLTVTFVPPEDSESDGMADSWEMEHFGNLTTANANTDTDNDGLSDVKEYQKQTDPQKADSDNDGMDDGWEDANGLNPLVDDSADDKDSDGSSNLSEFQAGTDPSDDSDYPTQKKILPPAILNLLLD
ncbi:MAG: Ig-like domain-containing protein [Desulfovibrio sp.]